ncbi:rnd efflux pump membrane fusion protein barrel-sandwich domain [Lucifera butyrica]|uniref:Rnd efflux pump membrane fusion protein barrel-sandwich domain n=1 Tax=Lucifera butyrica TaxID=1351585 RepID=A0A498RAI6_9FIRM|nr:efflux RND transporter periplasmic adaptor subunit [Lucifera butyrica]VBB08189.1 rnd efflux pump membrane fusion protein barrel-sandwich domain [Lucifera butyrica]
MKRFHWLTKLPKKQLHYGLAAAAGLCIAASVILSQNSETKIPAEETVTVRTITIHTAEDTQEYTYAGEVRGWYESHLAFQVGGKIIKRNVELGSKVKAGDILMRIDAQDIQQMVTSSSAQVASAESQLRLAESNLNRYKKLFADGAISQALYEQYVNAYNVAAAGEQQASSQYVQSANQLAYSRLRADKPGIVSNIAAEAGQVVGAGQTVITIVQDGEREVEISVPENRMEKLCNAGQIKVTFWALPKVTVAGKIREIAPMADPITRTFKARIRLINPPPAIELGMTATVHVADSRAQQTINIPLAAVYQTGNTPAVWVVKDNVLALQPITTGQFGNGTIQVLSGLKQGDCIVTAGVHKLREGQKARSGGDSL